MGTFRERIKKILPEAFKYQYRVFRKFRKRRRLEKEYAGDKVICVICKHKYRIFEPFKNIENEKCTNCGSMKRHRLLYQYLTTNTEIFDHEKPKKILHFAPEKAFYDILSSQKNVEYYPSDLEPESYQFYRKTKIYQANITEIPFRDNSFDVVLCNHVLEHILDDSKAMKELFRVLKKGGWGIFQVPIDFCREETYEDDTKTTPEERYVAFGQMDHVRWYGNDYPSRLKKAGFEVNDINFTEQFTEEEKFKFGFPEKESIYLCRKR